MKVYALVGPSGTGKSHRAGLVAHTYDIPLMIDDGLLIWNGKILAGRSAKREESKLAAVRTALFYNEDLIKQVKEGIKYAKEDKILILGTSVKMVERIIEALDLPGISKLIDIKSIASKEEMNKALEIRKKEGKHVIPVPVIEIKSHFPGYFLNPLEILFNKGDQHIKKEKTIVRPKFSYFGNLIIYNNVIIDLIRYCIKSHKSVEKIKGIKIDQEKTGLQISFNLILKYGVTIPEYVGKLKKDLINFIENYTGIEVLKIDIEISSLYMNK